MGLWPVLKLPGITHEPHYLERPEGPWTLVTHLEFQSSWDLQPNLRKQIEGSVEPGKSSSDSAGGVASWHPNTRSKATAQGVC